MIRYAAEAVVVLLAVIGLVTVVGYVGMARASMLEAKQQGSLQARRARIASLERALQIDEPIYADKPAPREGEIMATFELRQPTREPYEDGGLYGRTRKYQR